MDDSEVERLDDLEIQSKEELYDAAEEDDQTETSVQPSYVTVLTEEDIRRRMEIEIQSVSDVTSISKAEATLLLSHFRWDVSKFYDKWFDNAKRVRETAGLLERSLDDPPSDDKEFVCGVCLESHPPEKVASVSCGHRICTRCWKSHINKIINENPDAEWNLWLKCPTPVGPYASCQASVGRGMIERFASEEEKSKYDRYLLRSYVEDNKTMKWCPASGCSCVIDLSPGSGNSVVTCLCLRRFCWNCSEDVHSPVDCKSAVKWLAMNINDNQNPNWVLENTVPCPKCKRRIEQNQDLSLKMKCLLPCNYDFCWLCHGDWTKHGEGTGCDSYTCIFDAVSCVKSDQWRNMAESAAYRYQDCYKNWESHELLMQRAKANLQQLDTTIQHLSNTQLATTPQLKFIQEAGVLIMECTRILKWTYVYDYYLPEDNEEKQTFLKHKQETVKHLLEKLKHGVENELPQFLYAEEPSEDFKDFCIKLTGLTSTTRNHIESLIRDLENGLDNVVPASKWSQRTSNGGASLDVR